MSSFKFVHLADVHLDTTFLSKKPDIRERLKRAVRDAFTSAVDLTLEEGAHALLVAGDLFDSSRLTLETESHLLKEVSRLDKAGVRFFYATGNHDPGRSSSRVHHIPWPSSVHLFAGASPETVTVLDAEGAPIARVIGAGHQTERETRNLAAKFPGVKHSTPCIALLHAYVAAAQVQEGHERYAPAGLQDFVGKGYAYWALGHIHRRQTVSEEASVYYSGNLQGRHAREDGAKGALLVEIKGDGAHVRFCPLAPIEWVVVEPAGLMDVMHLPGLISKVVGSLPQRSAPEFILRVRLAGPCGLYQELMVEENRLSLEEDLGEATGALSVEVLLGDLLPPIDAQAFRVGPHVLSTALEVLEMVKEGKTLPGLEGEHLAAEALGVIKPNDPLERAAYLKQLLQSLDREMAFRVVKQGEV